DSWVLSRLWRGVGAGVRVGWGRGWKPGLLGSRCLCQVLKMYNVLELNNGSCGSLGLEVTVSGDVRFEGESRWRAKG
ncbi:hypothetical protein G0U57_016751, partial [Chelydra serpentina]